jgi:23S rRNA (adenine2503-C2)-methyltransferase
MQRAGTAYNLIVPKQPGQHETRKCSILTPVVTQKSSQFVRLDAVSPPDGSSASVAGSGKPLFGLDEKALAALMVEAGEPAWRGRQLAEALYHQRLTDLDTITTLPKALRQQLAAKGWWVGRPRIAQVFHSVDGTERYLVECQSRDAQPGTETVETVWMPEGDGGESGDGSEATDLNIAGAPGLASETWESSVPPSSRLSSPPMPRAPSFPRFSAERVGNLNPQFGNFTPPPPSSSGRSISEDQAEKRWNRATICVSSQIGCAVNCSFCLTAKLGLQRNLSAGEIAGQVIAVFDRHAVEVGRDRVNLVFMGMGEPFLNYENFMAAVRLLVREAGLSPQRMTVSTSGIVPGIERFAQEPSDLRPKLAISLNAPNDAVRGEIMPINRKWPIEAVVDAVRAVQLRPRERITFEYVLLGGVTDRPGHAIEVARLVRRSGLSAKVNLIAWNPGPGIEYATPQPEAVEAFRSTLAGEGIPTYLRKPRGRDIYAACGQLKRTVEG